MSWGATLREAAFAGVPPALRPVATFHYRRARMQTDPEMELLCQALHAGVRAIDVGANEGLYTHAFARTGAQVEAFEPLPACHAVLRAYARRRRGVSAHPVALGAAAGTAMLSVPRRNGRAVTGHASLEPRGGDVDRVTVDVRTLDSYGFDRVAVLKVDVEGHELSVIRGARETITRWRPLLLLELEQRHLAFPLAQAFAEVLSLGYLGQFVDGASGLAPLDRFDPLEHQRAERADVPGARYVNNFLFTPLAGMTA